MTLLTLQSSQQHNHLLCNVVLNIEALFWEMSKRVRSIQSEKSISRSGDFWGLSTQFLVYTFVLMLTKNHKNRTTGIRDFLA